MQVFGPLKPDDDWDPVRAANELLEKVKINGRTETDETPTLADHTKGSTFQSLGLPLKAEYRCRFNKGAMGPRSLNHHMT